MNLIGALLGVHVADTIAKKIVFFGEVSTMKVLVILLAALAGAIVWNLITWLKGLPSSSSHALIGGLVGSGLAASVYVPDIYVQWMSVVEKVVLPMFISPIIGFTAAFLLMILIFWLFRNSNPAKTNKHFKIAQIFSSMATALGHGLQDAQKTMGIIFLCAVAMDWELAESEIPLWIKVLSASAIAFGTYSGGFKIIKTLGRKIIDVDPVRGFTAELVAAGVLWVASFGFSAPISTTHAFTSAIMGAGASKRLSAVRWGVAKDIVGAWFLTLPAAALVAAIIYFGIHPFL
jgi:PiT family inorganic phosphate transporter